MLTARVRNDPGRSITSSTRRQFSASATKSRRGSLLFATDSVSPKSAVSRMPSATPSRSCPMSRPKRRPMANEFAPLVTSVTSGGSGVRPLMS